MINNPHKTYLSDKKHDQPLARATVDSCASILYNKPS